jgi:methionyl aminopeptidase
MACDLKEIMAAILKSKEEIMIMRESCRLAAETLIMIEPHVKAGVSTNELNEICHEFTLKNNAVPAPLGYHGFPKSICTSVNDVVCHGIPNDITLKDGDIINVDVTPIKNGFHGDSSVTFLVGNVSEEKKELVAFTQKCLDEAISLVKPGIRLGDIGHCIQTMAEEKGYGVVSNYCGHGIGRGFHEDPSVVHVGKPNTGETVVEGMVFTIEPMINLGTAKNYTLDDGWTVKTKDGSVSAQFEHTMAVTSYGVDVLTAR